MAELNGEKQKQGIIGCLVIVGVIIIIFLLKPSFQNNENNQSSENKTVSESLHIPAMSAWDGIAYAVKDYLRENANNPKSIDYIECSYMLEFYDGSFGQRVKFRGENLYGGLVINEFVFLIRGVGNDAMVYKTYTMEEFNVIGDKSEIRGKYNSEGERID